MAKKRRCEKWQNSLIPQNNWRHGEAAKMAAKKKRQLRLGVAASDLASASGEIAIAVNNGVICGISGNIKRNLANQRGGLAYDGKWRGITWRQAARGVASWLSVC